jgi:methionine-rich copper-binding protein CopC
MSKWFHLHLAAALALASMPGAALAHAKLVGSTPAANATASKVSSVTLKFSEKLIASTVKAELVMTGMPGMKDHAPMKIAFTSAMGKDGKSMTLQPRRMLVPGTYKVKWSAAGADTHRMGSEFSFTVK